MKKIYTLFVALIITGSLMAQTPQSFKYQAVVRDASGDVVVNEQVNFQLSIIEGSALGTAVYIEQHTDTTNQFGLINLVIGNGSVLLGDFASVDWGNNNYFLKVELNGVHIGTSQLLSVPYALHAKTAANIFSGNYSDLTGTPNNVSTFTNDAGYLTSLTETDPIFGAHAANGITSTNITNWSTAYSWGDHSLSGYLTSFTETDPVFNNLFSITSPADNQLLKYNSATSKWENWTANFLTTEVDGDVTNEIQDLSLSSNTLSLTGDATSVDLSGYLDNTDNQNLSNVLSQGTNAGGNNITNLADPTDAQDAATKEYVDALEQQITEMQNSLIAAGSMVRDYDGNVYGAVTIGTQKWMTENLKTTHYANGDEIPDGTGAGDISGETDPKYWFVYNDVINNVSTYGRLYTWYTVIDSRNVCPDGWHMPTDAEWTTLTDYLGGTSVAGGKLKETGITHWTTPNTGATNETGFTALPGSYRHYLGAFIGIGYNGYWWSSTEGTATSAWYRGLNYYRANVNRSGDSKKYSFSVRCVRD